MKTYGEDKIAPLCVGTVRPLSLQADRKYRKCGCLPCGCLPALPFAPSTLEPHKQTYWPEQVPDENKRFHSLPLCNRLMSALLNKRNLETSE